MASSARGKLLLVVGASGAGKDTLIGWARRALPASSPIEIMEREITRPLGPGEHHVPIDDAELERRSRSGYYVLEWRAHGVRYGIPDAARHALERGHSVLTIASRSVRQSARELPYEAHFIEICAPLEMLRERLEARERRPGSEVACRLARANVFELRGEDVHAIDNGGALADSGAAFVELLLRLAPPRPHGAPATLATTEP